MNNYFLYVLVFVIGASCAHKSGYEQFYIYDPPLICKKDSRLKAQEIVSLLIKESDPEIIKKVQNSSYENLKDFHFGFGQWIRNNWFVGKHKRQSIIDFYMANQITDKDTMSSDLTEGVWVLGDANRCNYIFKKTDIIRLDEFYKNKEQTIE